MKLRGYIFSKPFLGERVPQHVQNIIIRDYCTKNNFQYLLSVAEYAILGSDLILQQTISEFNKIDGIVAYSIFQLPEDWSARQLIVKIFLDSKKEMHFACENMVIRNNNDFQKIESIWQIKSTFLSNDLQGDLCD